ncbi:oligosaccharide flippase family protein [Candidatus Woesearchaeota archaeon]|nr:oligosaccharide flippase family protein [Candidatus Woesearchaeota archaeon]
MEKHVKKVATSTIILFILMGVSYVAAYFLRLVYARILTPAEYGLFYAVLGIVNFFIIFRDLGLSETLVKYIPEFKAKKEYDKIKSSIIFVTLVQFFVGLFIVICFWFLSDYLALNYFKNIPSQLVASASLLVKIISASYLIQGFTEVMTLTLNGFQKPRYYGVKDFVRNFFTLVIALFLYNFRNSVLIPGFAYIGGMVFTVVIMVFFFLRSFNIFRYKTKINFKLIKLFFGYSLQIMIGTGAGIIVGYANTILLTYFSGIEAVGSFNIALPTAGLMVIFAKTFGMILVPMSSELWIKKAKNKIKQILELIYHFLFIMIVPAIFTIFAFTDIVVRLVFGDKYLIREILILGIPVNETTLSLKILLIGILLSVIARINFCVISGIGQPKKRTISVYLAAFSSLIFSFVLIPFIHAVGASIATSISYMVLLICSFIFLRKFIEVNVPVLDWIKVSLIGVVYLTAIFFLKRVIELPVFLEMGIVIGISMSVYVVLLFVFKVLKVEQIKKIFFCFFQM